MSYKIYNNTNTKTPTNTALNRIRGEVQQIISEREFEFYELEPVEVVDILLDEKKLPNIAGKRIKDTKYYGAIKGKFIHNKKQNIKPSGEKYILPLDPHIKNYPVIGENVVCVNYLGRTYYTNIINFKNNPNNNIQAGMSEVGDSSTIARNSIYENERFNFNAKANAGDIVFQGRYGSSINIGAQNYTKSSIKLVAGHNSDGDYNIKKDGASIYIQDGGAVQVQNPNDKIKTYPVVGKKIILDADYIVLNAKKDIKITSGNLTEIIGKDVEFKHNQGGTIFTGETRELLDNTRDQLKNQFYREIELCARQLAQLVNAAQEDFERLEELQEQLESIPDISSALINTLREGEITLDFTSFSKIQQDFVKADNKLKEKTPTAATDPVGFGRALIEFIKVSEQFLNPDNYTRVDIQIQKKK